MQQLGAFRAASLVVALAMAIGCGSSTTTTAAVADPTPDQGSGANTHPISGRASAGPIAGGTVTVHAVSDTGELGAVLGTATTDATGAFSLNVAAGDDALLALSISGGTYIEEADGSSVTLTAPIRSMVTAQAGAGVGITPLTEVVVQRALATGTAAGTFAQAVADASYALSQATGLTDVTRAPADPNATQTNPTGAGAKYALVLAGLSQVANTYGASSINLATALATVFAQTGQLDPAAATSPVNVTRADGTAAVLAGATWSAQLPAAVSTFLVNRGVAIGLTAASMTSFNAAPPLTRPASPPPPPSLVSLSLALEGDGTLAVGTTDRVHVQGSFADDTHRGVGAASLTWTSSAPSVATVSDNGTVTAVAAGDATITGTAGSVTSSVNVHVTGATLTSLAINSAHGAMFGLGTVNPLQVVGNFSDDSHQVLNTQVTWTSDHPAIVAVGPQGLAAGLSLGSATITAAVGSIHATLDLTVTPGPIQSLAISRVPAGALAVGTTAQITTRAIFGDDHDQALGAEVHYESSTPAVATVSPTGTITAVAAGTASIIAHVGPLAVELGVTVTAATVSSIAITAPNGASLAKGLTTQLTATATLTDGSHQVVTSAVAWTSSNQATATVSASGMVTTVAPGTTTITAAAQGGVSQTFALTVTPAAVTSVAVTSRQGTSIPAGFGAQLDATASYTDGTTAPVTGTVSWMTSDATKATVDVHGIVTAVAPGAVTITGTLQNQTLTQPLTVTSATLTTIALPTAPSVAVGATTTLTATGTFSSGPTALDISHWATWTSDATNVATVAADGVVSGVVAGTANITAAKGGVTQSVQVTVTAAGAH